MAITSNKQIPIAVLNLLQPYFRLQHERCRRAAADPKYLVKYVDADNNSDFFFEITSYNVDTKGTVRFATSFKPESTHSVGIGKLTVAGKNLTEQFNAWVGLLETYTKLRGPVENDSILNQYQKEFEEEFVLVEDDADTAAFNFKQQERIVGFLEAVNKRLEETKDETNKAEIEDIQKDIQDLKKEQGKLPKRKVFKKISKIVAKCQKASFEAGKWAVEVFIKAFAESMVKQLLEPK
jgi:hypothetical protein